MKKIVYSPGEPSGIGPDLIIQLCKTPFWKKINVPVICIADPQLIKDRAKSLKKNIKIELIQDIKESHKNIAGTIQVMCIAKCSNTKFGKLYKSNAMYVLKNLDYGINEALNKENVALVTGPISKENVISVKKDFSGHTEHIQKLTKSNDVLMLLGSSLIKGCNSNYAYSIKKGSKGYYKKAYY